MSTAIALALILAAVAAGPAAIADLKKRFPDLAGALDAAAALFAQLTPERLATVPAEVWADIAQLATTGRGPISHDPTETA